jgi:hypothetical protein
MFTTSTSNRVIGKRLSELLSLEHMSVSLCSEYFTHTIDTRYNEQMTKIRLKSRPWLPFDPGMLLSSRPNQILQLDRINHGWICLVQAGDSG